MLIPIINADITKSVKREKMLKVLDSDKARFSEMEENKI